MTEPIQPALTAEEWEAPPQDVVDGVVDWEMGIIDISTDDKPERLRHQLAALALYGQPFGFTREDVTALRNHGAQVADEYGDWSLLEIAERVNALLPPEKPS